MKISFFVEGTPATQGSKTAFPTRRGFNIVDSCKKNRVWKKQVSLVAQAEMLKAAMLPLHGPVALTMVFFLQRPRKHFIGRDGLETWRLRPDAPEYHIIKPDALKLGRAVEDALSGVCYHDDSQVAMESICKLYSNTNRPGVEVMIERIDDRRKK